MTSKTARARAALETFCEEARGISEAVIVTPWTVLEHVERAASGDQLSL
jgi:hypothetical protein